MLSLAAALALAGCGSFTTWLESYTIDIQQGNHVSQDDVSRLKLGMSKEQVRFVLGTPLVTDIFHADRWDYVYYHKIPRGKTQRGALAVFFKDGKLVQIMRDIDTAGADAKPTEERK